MVVLWMCYCPGVGYVPVCRSDGVGMLQRTRWWLVILMAGLLLPMGAIVVAGDDVVVVEGLDVARVWSGHPVSFCLLTHGDVQFVGYYDADRRMTVASRLLGQKQWRYDVLGEKVGWDSHNSITMAVDDNDCVHLAGNMHCVPLVYFRMKEPMDAGSFERFRNMVGSLENRCTYPHFFRGANGELIFTYRDGGSGNGNQIYNVYDCETRNWSRLLDKPLTDGKGLMNAYLRGPTKGADGWFHLVWVWRNTPDCATNHDVSYAKSRDLKHWENAQGRPVELPFTIDSDVVVDAVPAGGGVINGNAVAGFDSKGRVVVSYHKYDEAGNTQIYNARMEDGSWVIYKASDWDYRWEFSGGGSIGFEVRVSPVRVQEGRLVQDYSHNKFGSGVWVLDEATLRPVGRESKPAMYPRSLGRVQSEYPGMRVNWREDLGGSGRDGIRYVLRWETLGANRDRPREGEPPAPTLLRVYALKRGE